MIKLSLSRLTAAAGGLALSLAAAAGVASAQPEFEPMINTTCTYDQAMAAVHAENPMAAQYLDSSPPNLEFLRVFVGSSPDQRRIDQPGAEQPGCSGSLSSYPADVCQLPKLLNGQGFRHAVAGQ